MEKLKFTIKLDIPGTKDLKPPKLAAECTIEMDADHDAERAKWAYDKKNYQKLLEKKLKEQAKHFATSLASMQKEIDELRKLYHQLTSAKDPMALRRQIKSPEALTKRADMQQTIKNYNDYLSDAVKNIEKQQSLIWHKKFEQEAEEAALKKIESDIKWKKVRTAVGVTIVGVLVVGAAAAAIAASIVSFGTVPAAIATIGVISASIGGASALTKTGRQMNDLAKLEKTSLSKLSADLDDVAVHLGKTDSKVKGLPKHLDDASRFHTLRRQQVKESHQMVSDLDTQIKELETQLKVMDKLDPTPAFVAKAKKQLVDLRKQRSKASAAIRDAMKKDEELNKLLERARTLVGDLAKIDFTGSRSLGDSLGRYKNFDSCLNAVDMVNAVAGSANTLAGALKA